MAHFVAGHPVVTDFDGHAGAMATSICGLFRCSTRVSALKTLIWVCLKIGYIPNYSHLIGIMIINHWV